jgi:hypothetical protein
VDAARHFEALADKEAQPAARQVFLATPRSFFWLAIADGRRLVREMPKRPPASSVRRTVKRKRASGPRNVTRFGE